MDEIVAQHIPRCVIITGMSGGGKSTALNILEDQGFYAIDNLPPSLLPQLMEVLGGHRSAVTRGVAAVVDVRSEALLEDLMPVVAALKKTIPSVQLVFLEASQDCLIRRFETTRRRHPMGRDLTIAEGIELERQRLASIREKADMIIESSDLTHSILRTDLLRALDLIAETLTVIVTSFGFKYGVPQDCDYMFDVRFLPNPNYIAELHNLSGKNVEVQEYLDKFPEHGTFLDMTSALIEYVIPLYDKTGKKQIHIAIGCTGGRHRSVAIAERLGTRLVTTGKRVVISHRDVDRESVRW